MLTEPARVMLLVAERLDRLGIVYAIGGSTASTFYSIPRATQDIDILIDLSYGRIAPLVTALKGDFYVDEASVREAVARGSSFNAIYLPLMFKVDFFVRGDGLLDSLQLQRRRMESPPESPTSRVALCSPEDVVLQKLAWFRRSGGVLERQIADVMAVLKVQASRLDIEYLQRTARALGLSDLLEDVLRKSGLRE